VPPLPAGSNQHVADVSVSYDNLGTHERNSASRRVSVTASRSPALVDKKANQAILVAAVEMLANEQNKLAVALRDEGKVDAAKQVLQENVDYLRNQNIKLRSKRIQRLEQFNRQNRDNLEGSEWNRSRKQMREVQMEMETQRSY
jgi:Ca-activated chloride channel family protein